jgi:membrane protease YdiL (CAAX protease family)
LTGAALLYAPNGALRAPWKIVAFLATTVVCAVIAAAILSPLQPLLAATGVPLIANSIIMCAAAGGATLTILRTIDRRPWGDLWLGRRAAKPRRWIEGFFLGLLAIGVPSTMLIASGWLAVEPHQPGSWTGAALRLSTLLLLAALAEELLFRGYLLAVLRQALGWIPALALTSVAFGYVHIGNPGSSIRALALVSLAGVFLGAVVVVTRSLYAAWMAHFAWNWTMAVVLHIPVSGLVTETPDYRTVDAGPDWATGGAWGPEGGAAGALGMLGGIGYLVARYRRGFGNHG